MCHRRSIDVDPRRLILVRAQTDLSWGDRAESGTGSSIIQVARISIAGRDVGPVWFTSRPDRSFHEYMSGMMDARVEGALGGSALTYFRVTVDYPRGRIIFQ